MSLEHLAQPGMLFRNGVVPAASAFFLEACELRSPLLPRGETFEPESASIVRAREVSEAKKLESLRLR